MNEATIIQCEGTPGAPAPSIAVRAGAVPWHAAMVTLCFPSGTVHAWLNPEACRQLAGALEDAAWRHGRAPMFTAKACAGCGKDLMPGTVAMRRAGSDGLWHSDCLHDADERARGIVGDDDERDEAQAEEAAAQAEAAAALEASERDA